MVLPRVAWPSIRHETGMGSVVGFHGARLRCSRGASLENRPLGSLLGQRPDALETLTDHLERILGPEVAVKQLERDRAVIVDRS